MTTYVTKIRVSPPTSLEPKHITHVWIGTSPTNTPGDSLFEIEPAVRKVRAGAIWKVRKAGTADESTVIVVEAKPPHLRTTPDGTPKDNLLALPRG